jgi:hypothetical protein
VFALLNASAVVSADEYDYYCPWSLERLQITDMANVEQVKATACQNYLFSRMAYANIRKAIYGDDHVCIILPRSRKTQYPEVLAGVGFYYLFDGVEG